MKQKPKNGWHEFKGILGTLGEIPRSVSQDGQGNSKGKRQFVCGGSPYSYTPVFRQFESNPPGALARSSWRRRWSPSHPRGCQPRRMLRSNGEKEARNAQMNLSSPKMDQPPKRNHCDTYETATKITAAMLDTWQSRPSTWQGAMPFKIQVFRWCFQMVVGKEKKAVHSTPGARETCAFQSGSGMCPIYLPRQSRTPCMGP